MHRRLLNGLMLTAALVAPGAAQAAAPPEGSTLKEAFFPSTDGTQLHADVLRPAGAKDDVRTPVILVVSPYLGHTGQTPTEADPTAAGPSDRFYDFYKLGKVFQRGYTVVQVDLRGYGGSQGCGDWGGPGEQADVKAAVEWAAAQPWSNGKVGMYGKSYDGWTGIMGLAMRPKGLAAVISQEPVVDGYRYIYMNGIHYSATLLSSQQFSAGSLKPGSTLSDSPNYLLGDLTPNAGCVNTPGDLVNEAVGDATSSFWAARNLLPRVKGAGTPLFLSYGFLEDNTKPDHVFDVLDGVTGPKRAWLGQWDHVRGTDGEPGKAVVGRNGFADEAMRFYDQYLKGEKPAVADPTIAVQRDNGSWRKEDAWPPADGSPWGIPLTSGAYADAASGSTASVPMGGTWTVTQALPHDVHISGVPRLSVELAVEAPLANLIATVYDVAPDGKGRILTRGGAQAPAMGTSLEFELYAQDWVVPAGHRVAIHLTDDDSSWYQVIATQGSVQIAKGALKLPALRFQRTSDLDGRKSDFLGKYAPAEIPAAVIAKAVTVALPPALAARAVAPPPAAARPQLKLVSLKRVKARGLRVRGTATGVTAVKVRVSRAGRTIAARTLKVRKGVFAVSLKLRRKGTYRVSVSAAGARPRARNVRIR